MKSRSGYLRLDMNENPSGLPVDFLATALSEFDITQIGTYPEYQLLIEKIAKKNGIGSENVCLANGSDGGIKYLFDAYVSQGDEVLMTDPTFAMYPVYCGMFNSKAIRVPYGQDFSFPFEKFFPLVPVARIRGRTVNTYHIDVIPSEQPEIAFKLLLERSSIPGEDRNRDYNIVYHRSKMPSHRFILVTALLVVINIEKVNTEIIGFPDHPLTIFFIFYYILAHM